MRKTFAIGAALSVAMVGSAGAQMSGVSHPDEAIEVNNPPSAQQSAQQPVQPIYQPYQAKPSALGSPIATAYVAPPSPAPAPIGTASAPIYSIEPGAHDANPDIDAGYVTRLPGPSNMLPEGTLVKVRLHQTLSTTATRRGMEFDSDLVEPVMRDGKVLLPAGSIISGRVTGVHGGKRISGAASIHLMPTSIVLPDGTRYGLRAQVIDTSLYKFTRVDSEGTILRRDHAKETFAIMGGVTGAGAVTGAVIGGVPGALVGAGVGAGISTAWWLKQDRQMELAAETKVTFALIGPLTVGM